jgi:hypothetical protein
MEWCSFSLYMGRREEVGGGDGEGRRDEGYYLQDTDLSRPGE